MAWYHYGILILTVYIVVVVIFGLRLSLQMFYKPGPLTNGVSCRGQTYDTNRRYEPLKGPVVYGYPSNGGILIKGVSAVELLYLDLDRFREAKRPPNAADENEFCKRLRKTGAAWWPSEGHWINAVIGEGDSENGSQIVQTGWPSSGHGVWVFKYDVTEWNTRRKVSLLQLILNMDERCQIIKTLGGSFFEDSEACEDLRFDMINGAAKVSPTTTCNPVVNLQG